MINPTKRGFQGDRGQENHSVSKALAFLAFLRSKRLSRSSRLLRSSWLREPMRPLRSSDSLRNLNSIIKWLETSYFVVFKTWFFSVRIMKFQVQLWHPSDLRLWRTGYVIYVKNDWWISNAHCSRTCLQRKINKIFDPSIPQNHLQSHISMWDTLYNDTAIINASFNTLSFSSM